MKSKYLPLALSGASLVLIPELAHGFTYPQAPIAAAHDLECYMVTSGGQVLDLTALCAKPVYVAAVAAPEYLPNPPLAPAVNQQVTVNVEIHMAPNTPKPTVKVSTTKQPAKTTPHKAKTTSQKQSRSKKVVAQRLIPRQGKG